jgi:hypothetical protein
MKKSEPKSHKKLTIRVEELDRKFDRGEDVSPYFDLDSTIRRVNVDFPQWMIDFLDLEATRLGINRQALIKVWIGDKIEALKTRAVG